MRSVLKVGKVQSVVFFLSRTFKVQLFVDVNMLKVNPIICSLVAYELLFLSHLLQRKINTSEGFHLDSRASASAIVKV